jgi:hypothetical protein
MLTLSSIIAIFIIALPIYIIYRAISGRRSAVKFCKSCEHQGHTQLKTRGSLLIEIVLWLMLIVPGLIYSLWRLSTRAPVCSKCGSSELVPIDSPVALRAKQ